MRYLLDTNILVYLLSGKAPQLEKHVISKPPGLIGLPTIVLHELYFGAYKSQRVAANLERIRLLLTDFPVLDFNPEDGRMAGEVRANLKARGAPIGPYDCLIAGQALARGLCLVTNNRREFERVEGLEIEDWS